MNLPLHFSHQPQLKKEMHHKQVQFPASLPRLILVNGSLKVRLEAVTSRLFGKARATSRHSLLSSRCFEKLPLSGATAHLGCLGLSNHRELKTSHVSGAFPWNWMEF